MHFYCVHFYCVHFYCVHFYCGNIKVAMDVQHTPYCVVHVFVFALDVQTSGLACDRTAQSKDGLICCHVQPLQETQLLSLLQQDDC